MTSEKLLAQILEAVPALALGDARLAVVAKMLEYLPQLVELYASERGLILTAAEVDIVDEREIE